MDPTISLPSDAEPLHFLLIPFHAQGHMIPLVDLAHFLSARGVLVTFFTTPVNLARIRPIVDRAAAAALPIRFVALHFPAADAGLPDGCESVDLLPSVNHYIVFMKALPLLRSQIEAHLQASDPAGWPEPACVISDNIQYWTVDLAHALKVPRLIYAGPSCFYLVCSLLINRHRPELQAKMADGSGGPVILPDLPQPIPVRKHEVASAWHSDPEWMKIREAVKEAEESSCGVLVNTFAELERWYLERYREEMHVPVWPVGPLSSYEEKPDSKAQRGRVSSIDNKLLVRWLDGKDPGSVVLVSFGSIAYNSMAQLVEIAHGLEASGRAFVWVVKEAAEGREVPGVVEWLGEFEKRVEGRGVVIRGWAPQVSILSHAAVGGFVTHCGWNSIIEAVAAGVVMATWPHFADQFLNERLVVDVLGIGVQVGVEDPTMFVMKGDDEPVKVGSGEVERAVDRLMGGGEEGEERRKRVRELREKAKRALEEGGSSWEGLRDVIAFVAENLKKKKIMEKTVNA